MSVTVHVRLDERLKEEASATLSSMGLTLSDVVRLLLVRVVAEKALPFEVCVPKTIIHERIATVLKTRVDD
ncbi:MAG: type II toxin-antitoxin system RelB/DinJ family antitoxin [Burkholderiales bacterium]